jgi:TPR repeat protein
MIKKSISVLLYITLLATFSVLGGGSYLEVDFYKSAPSEIFPFVSQVIADAEKGNTSAQLKLSVIYSRGIGVEKSPEQSSYWLAKAADNGDPAANFFLGEQYLIGTRYRRNIPKALQMLQLSASGGNTKAMSLVGAIRYGMYGPSFMDLTAAKKYLKQASDDGNGSSSFLLSCIYKYDIYDKNLFNKYIKLSFEQNSRSAIKYEKGGDLEYLSGRCRSLRLN